MVNVPNWLPLRFRLPGGDWILPDTANVLDHRLMLHLSVGLLERRTRYGLGDDGVLTVRQQRIVHMGDPHLAALRTEFTAEGFSGPLEVEAALDGGVTNSGVARYTSTAAPPHRTQSGCAAARALPTSGSASPPG
jgi:trehalose/maltose hydrolase-like predicted phosphorylase